MRDPRKGATLLLAVYSLNQHGGYIKKMITFKSDVECDVDLPLCLCETSNGDFEFTLEDIHLSSEIPQPDEPDDVPGPVTHLEATETLVVSAAWHIPPLRPTLPENPTAAERWKYLVEVLKQRAEH